MQSAKTPSDIKNLKKLKGAHNCYRIRVGEYRIGVIIEGHTVEIIRFLSRKNVYDQFP
ncbi:type II toxin-antitoxin system RelE/ParE family toxin [Persicitalea sp.]|uniref:type II toxin-antitoxin system RelE family toxin n=1 Tax=Persicitalea sp. TaxID=3100273 RepID=UPI0035936D89